MSLFTNPVKPKDQYVIENNSAFSLNFEASVEIFKRGFDNIWHNPDDYTPQEMFDVYGTEGVLLVMRSEATKLWINSVDPDILPAEYQTAPNEIQVNQDGTVTVL